MIRREMPSLLETTRNESLEKSIETNRGVSGRLSSDVNSSALQKSLIEGKNLTDAHKVEKAIVVTVDDSGDKVDPNLIDTHSESWHEDADAQVVKWLTTTGQVDVANCPVHNNPSHPAPLSFPMAQPTFQLSVSNALDDIEKSHEKKKDNLSKAGSGAGSRGGKIVGHTKSGKPIYANADHSSHAKFSVEDHNDAMSHHQKVKGKSSGVDVDGRRGNDDYENSLQTRAIESHRSQREKKLPKKEAASGGDGTDLSGILGAKHNPTMNKFHSHVTAHDIKNSKKSGYNVHALGHYASGMAEARKKIKDHNDPHQTIHALKQHFESDFPPLKKLIKEHTTKSLSDTLDDLIKSTPGEGSRGGKIIGHTRSGKPVYDNHGHAAHAGFSKPDHRDAAKMHDHIQEEMDKKHANGVIGGTESTPHKDEYLHHLDQQTAHEASAGGKRKEKYDSPASFARHPKGPSAGLRQERAKHSKDKDKTRAMMSTTKKSLSDTLDDIIKGV